MSAALAPDCSERVELKKADLDNPLVQMLYIIVLDWL